MKIKDKFLKIFKILLTVTFILASLIVIKDEISYRFGIGDYYENDYDEESYYEDDNEGNYCMTEDNVLGIMIYGDLYTYDYNLTTDDSEGYLIVSAEEVIYEIGVAEQDPNIKAILLEIDSWGGESTAAKEISDAIKRAKKPTVVVIREAGVSGAYWVATGADVIFANTTSNVGGIGVTMSYLDYSEKNKKDGLIYQQISSGKFKDSGDPDKVLTWEEKKLLQRDVDLLNKIFISEVASNRNKNINEVEKWADGSSMLGQMALEKGLIDMLGDEYDAIKYLEEKLNEDVSVCWW